MTREEMSKIKWEAYMEIAYQTTGMKTPMICLLSAIDFDAEILQLQPLPIELQKECWGYIIINKGLFAKIITGMERRYC